jgi:hypothetical protein
MSKEIGKKVSSEKICKLLVETLLNSKAKRICFVFKPKEVVVDENYALGLTFTNQGDIAFDGGKIEVQTSYIIGQKELQLDLTQSIPKIPPKHTKSIDFGIQKAEASGKVLLRIMKIIPNNQNVKVECYSKFGENLLDRQQDNLLTFSVSSRQEIYAKYGFIVALFFSIIAMILSIINAIASLISMFG